MFRASLGAWAPISNPESLSPIGAESWVRGLPSQFLVPSSRSLTWKPSWDSGRRDQRSGRVHQAGNERTMQRLLHLDGQRLAHTWHRRSHDPPHHRNATAPPMLRVNCPSDVETPSRPRSTALCMASTRVSMVMDQSKQTIILPAPGSSDAGTCSIDPKEPAADGSSDESSMQPSAVGHRQRGADICAGN